MKRNQLKAEIEKAAQRFETIESDADNLILRKGQLAIDYAVSHVREQYTGSSNCW